MMSAIKSQFGGADICINNAGLAHNAPLLSGSTEMWREMLEVCTNYLSIAEIVSKQNVQLEYPNLAQSTFYIRLCFVVMPMMYCKMNNSSNAVFQTIQKLDAIYI